MLKMFKKRVKKKPTDFKFSKSGYVLSNETLKEYEYIKKIYFTSVEILKGTSNQEECIEEIKHLIQFYEKSDTLFSSLMNEIFTQRFIDSIDKRLALFVLLDKVLKLFFMFDLHRNNSVWVFDSYSKYKIKNRNAIHEKEVYKLSIFSSIAMPMGRLFMSYFSSDNFELFHPIVLKKRTTLFLDDMKQEYLKFVCAILSEHTELKYLKIFIFSLYEKICKDYKFDKFYERLNSREKSYYIDLVDIS